MKSNTLTHDQAYKVYTGNGMLIHILKISGFCILFNLLGFVFFLIIALIMEGNVSAALHTGYGSMMSVVFAVSGIIFVVPIGFVDRDRHLPGGKYFRTVKGGFDTYRKMKDASLIVYMVSLALIMLFGVICERVGVFKYEHGVADIFAVVAFLLLSVGLLNLMNLIENPELRVAAMVITYFIVSCIGVLYVLYDYANVTFALIVAAVSIPFIAVTHKMMLSNYRKNRWDK